MGLCAGAGGNTARAVALFTEAAARGGEALWVKAAALNNAGVVLLHDGRYREAEPYLREGLSANEQEGDRRGIAHSKASLGELSYRLARLEEARRWLDASIAEAAEIEDTQCRTLAALLLSRVHVLEGRAEAAREALATAPPPGPADDPEIEAMRRLADRDAALGVGEAASCPPLETPQEECERSAACRNAQAEALCLEIEAALRRGDRAVAEERRAALEELRFQASDRHLRRYAEWLLRVAELGEAAGMLPASVDGEASMFDVRGRRLREGWAAGPPTSP
jgi:hypothetical protein